VKRLSNDKGSALVEFAIVLPVFLLVVIGSITFVWLLGARSAVTGAARDGARYASIQHDWINCSLLEPCDMSYPDREEVESYIQDRAGVFGVDCVHMVVGTEPADDSCTSGNEPVALEQPERNELITVTAHRKLPNIFGAVASLFGIDEITYTTTAVARAE
jgi:hypothetical protein